MDGIINDEIVLCAASAYEEKFYLNPESLMKRSFT